MFDKVKGSPTLRLKSDYISADKNKDDGKLDTPNPLYPNGGYFGMNPQVGPANRANGSLRLSSSDSKERYIGTAFITTFSWDICNFLNYNIGVQYFKTGSFINDVIPQHQNGFFVGSVIRLKF